MDGGMAEEVEEFDEFEDEDGENEDYDSDEYEESEEHQYNGFTYPMSGEAQQQNPPAGLDEPLQSPEVLSLSQAMRKSTSAAGRRSLRSSRASSRSRIARFGRWTANAWNDTKSLFLGPLFIGMALGVGISLGRSTFLVAMQRTTSLLLGRSGSARFGIAS